MTSDIRFLCQGLLEGTLPPIAFLVAVQPDPLQLDTIVVNPPLEWTAQHVVRYLERFGAGEIDEEELAQWATLLVGMDRAFRCRGAPEDLVAQEALFQITLEAASNTLTPATVTYWYERILEQAG
uniref:Uncharacterized protein n=1 Tax=uncultured prokaryote TaxID=198431 RepID=H5SLH1_9ZZZZ|nr:hypothetical protein HGMM_F46A05C46 [uncultured prokaryote]